MNQITNNAKVTYTVTRKTAAGLETIKRTGIAKINASKMLDLLPPRPGMILVGHKAGYSEWVDADKLTIA